jgi:hypothetical protein
MGELDPALEVSPPAMFPHSGPVACVCCRVHTATSPTDGTCDQCTLILSNMASRKFEEQSVLKRRVENPDVKHRPPPVVDVFDNDTFSVDASSLRQSASSSLSNPRAVPDPAAFMGTPSSLSPGPRDVSVYSQPSLNFVDALLARESSTSIFGSTLRNHGYRLVVDWGLAPPDTNIPSILANYLLPSGVSAAVPKKSSPTILKPCFRICRCYATNS